MLKCAECPHHGCQVHDVSNAMVCCPTKNGEIQQQASELYKDPENYTLAHNAAVVEAEGYGRLCRMEEIMLFARKCGYNRIGPVSYTHLYSMPVGLQRPKQILLMR